MDKVKRVAQSLLAIIPLFILIGLGYLARQTILDSRMLPALNQFVYYFALPALLFNSARRQNLEYLFNWPALAAFTLAAVVTALITMLGSRWLFACKSMDGLIMRSLNTTFANYAYMGIPLTFGLLGEATHAPTISIILAGNLVVVGGIQLLLEIQSHGASVGQAARILERSLLRSPIVLATMLGLLFSGLHLTIPKIFNDSLDMLAPATIPVALFCLGASLAFKSSEANKLEIAWIIGIKLLVHPALTWAALLLLGVTDRAWLLATVLLTSLPTGALVHVVAMRYDLFEKGSSQIIVLSTLLSIGSVAVWAGLLGV